MLLHDTLRLQISITRDHVIGNQCAMLQGFTFYSLQHSAAFRMDARAHDDERRVRVRVDHRGHGEDSRRRRSRSLHPPWKTP